MHTTHIRIIGIDCATDPANVGLALGYLRGDRVWITELTTGTRKRPVSTQIVQWIQDDMPTLLALDSPLGWPIQLGTMLASHTAGDPLPIEANDLFRRETDRFIRKMIQKQPMEVAADRIARTAHAALALLADLRILTGQAIPLAWKSEDITSVHAIEVYPAATLLACGYTKPKDARHAAEQAILAFLTAHVDVPAAALRAPSRHAIDAAICVLAGADVIRGIALPPQNLALAKKEGWIWVRPKRIAQ